MATPETNDRFLRVEALFNAALEQPNDLQEEWLRGQCGGDIALFDEAASILRAYRREQDANETVLQSRGTSVAGNVHLGPYEVLSLLGRGGMGAVYLAQRADGQYEKKVAIKLIDLPLATEVFTERFRQERQILAGLDHPGIARMLDGGVTGDGVLYIVMEYVDGETIDAYCRNHAVSLEQRLEIFGKICKAVQFAHQNLVIHRDLKPDNILVSADGEPHLLDFGTAKLITADHTVDVKGLTRQGFLSFTPAYASPEQVLGKSITTASDTYSLGVLLYLLLTGRPPYELSEFTTEEMVRIICETMPETPTDAEGIFPNADLEAILAKALRKEPEQRYQTAEQLAADVEAYQQHRPVLARRGNLRYTSTKFIRRNKLAFLFSSLLLLMLVGGVIAVAWQAHVARRAERRAEARSADLLQLSDSLLSELDSAIQQLPGSTGAQQLLVGRVLEHLQRLSADARMDKATGLSLAAAYMRLGSLQGDPYEQNLGDTAGALKSLDKAKELLMSLATSSPNDVDAETGLARAEELRGEVLSLAEDNPGAVAAFQAANQHYAKLLAVPNPSAKLCFEAAVAYELLGDVMGQDTGFADPRSAMTDYRKAMDLDARALSIDPTFSSVRRGLVLMQLKIGKVHVESDPALALLDYGKAFELYNDLPSDAVKKLPTLRLHGLLLRKQASAFCELGRYTEALPLLEQSEAVYEAIRSADAKDLRSKRDMRLLLENETDCAEDAADPALQEAGYEVRRALLSAEQAFGRSLPIMRELFEAKPDDGDLPVQIASAEVHLAMIRRRLRHPGGDVEGLAVPLKQIKMAALQPKASPMVLLLAFKAFESLKETPMRDPEFLLACAKQGDMLTHHQSAEWILMLAKAYQSHGDAEMSRKMAGEGMALLPAMNAANKNFRVRRSLQVLEQK